MISADSVSLRDYSHDYNQIKMINQSHGFESSHGGMSESIGNYNTSLTSNANSEITESSDHCLLPNFPSYFSNQEDKTSKHLNHKPNKSQHTTSISSCLNDSRHSQSEHKSFQLTNYRHNI